MPVYNYSGLSPEGKTVKGRISAESAPVARKKLREAQVAVTAFTQAGEGLRLRGKKALPMKILTRWCEGMALRLQAGIPVAQALHALGRSTESPIMAWFSQQTAEGVMQ